MGLLIKKRIFALVIELEKHIEILLLNNDCVIVPGLGGFTASHIPARYDDNDCHFIPPSRTLGFNSKLNINDSLLVQSYSESYDISFPEAFTRVENETNELKQHIYNEGFYELTDIGTLYTNDEGNIGFSPCEAGILTPSLYSLSSFEMKKNASGSVEKSSTAGLRTSKKSKTVVRQDITQASDNNRLFVKEKTADENTESKKRSRDKFVLFRNAVAIIILIFSFMVLSEPATEKSGMTRMGNFDTGIVHNLIKNGYKNITSSKDIHLKEFENKQKNLRVDVQVEANTENAQQKDVKEDNPYYCIVLASKVSKTNAYAFVGKLVSNGFGQAKILLEKGKSIKVVYGHYKTQNEAYNALNDLKNNELFYEAWIYEAK